MACYHPITAYRSMCGPDPKTGKWPIVFNITKGYSDMPVTVPCGQCIGCRLEKSRQWAIRCFHESKLHQENCFLTLTYHPDYEDHLKCVDERTGELNLTLNKRDYVLFLKKVRKEFGSGIRFFQCGEYGEHCSFCGEPHLRCSCGLWNPVPARPHHHILLFGLDFKDKYLWLSNNGFPLYRSPTLEKLWTFGYSSIADVTFESAAYVARYITKKITGDRAEDHYCGRMPEYITMSRRPGIARDFAEKWLSDFYPSDKCVIRPGMVARPPKFYDDIYDAAFHEKFLAIKAKRKRYLSNNVEEHEWERLAVKEKIQVIKSEKLVRPIENGKAVIS